MTDILLALQNAAQEQFIRRHSPSAYRFVTLLDAQESDSPTIGLFDHLNWEKALRWAVNHPNHSIYWVLVVDQHVVNHPPPQSSQDHEYDLISFPLEPYELQIRLRSIVRMRDRSEKQRRIYQKLAFTNKALESTSDAVIVADADGMVVYVNPAFSKTFGFAISELNVVGIPNTLFRDPQVGQEVFQAIRRDGSWRGEVDLKTSGGEVIAILFNADTIKGDGGEPIGLISICTDITQQKLVNAMQHEQRLLAEVQLDTLRAMTSSLDPAEVFSRILENIGEVVPNDAANIIIIQDGKAQLVDRDDYSGKTRIQPLKDGELEVEAYDDLREMLQTRTSLVISDVREYLRTHSDMRTRTPWLNSHIGIPIKLREEIIGFLNVDSIQPGLFGEREARRLELFAEQAAIAIHNTRLHERGQKLAMLEERQRLARNLHDAVSQTLFSANLIAEALPKLWETQPDDVLPRLEQIRTLNRGALAKMRTLLLELHPERLWETSLEDLFQQLTEGVLGQTQIDVILYVTSNLSVPPGLHTAIYYITQEALNNVAKHANASTVAVRLTQEADHFTLQVHDDGDGFDPDTSSSMSLGLKSIRERAQETGGELSIESSDGEGTRIIIHWPR